MDSGTGKFDPFGIGKLLLLARKFPGKKVIAAANLRHHHALISRHISLPLKSSMAIPTKKIVVFTGAGISAESGISTFRDSGGLWEKYDIRDVATPEAWRKNPNLVLEFYNQRRKQVLEAKPNAAHLALTRLEKNFDVHIITQNVDDLHERAGSRKVLHLHGEIRKSRSTLNPKLVYDVKGWEIKAGDRCEEGSAYRLVRGNGARA
jgi:NAD-dependent SIR2 family protein deacetylase